MIFCFLEINGIPTFYHTGSSTRFRALLLTSLKSSANAPAHAAFSPPACKDL